MASKQVIETNHIQIGSGAAKGLQVGSTESKYAVVSDSAKTMTLIYDKVTYNFGINDLGDTVPASGGTYTITASSTTRTHGNGGVDSVGFSPTTVTVPANTGSSYSSAVTITQNSSNLTDSWNFNVESDYIIAYGDLDLSSVSMSCNDVPASGGSVTSGTVSGTIYQVYYYKSGRQVTNSFDADTYKTGWSGGASDIASLGETTKARTAVGSALTATFKINGKSNTKSITVYQAKNELLSYGALNVSYVSLSCSDVPASGGSVTSGSVSGTIYQDYNWDSGTYTHSFTASSYISSWTGGASDVASLKETEKARTAVGNTLYANFSINSKTASKGVTVYQAANSLNSYGSLILTAVSISCSDVPASGGSITSGTASGTIYQYYNWTSGSYLHSFTASSYVKWSGGASSIASLGETAKTRTAVGSALTATFTVNSKSDTKSITVYQAANSLNSYGDLILTAVTVSCNDVPASGGSITSGTVSGTIYQYYNWTSGSYLHSFTASDYRTGWSGGASSIASLGETTKARTAVGSALTATFKVNEKTNTKSVTVYQAKNELLSYGALNLDSVSVSCGKIPASGGTITSGSVSGTIYQNYNWDSGSYSHSFTASSYLSSWSGGASDIASLGTTAKSETEVGSTLYANFSVNSKTASKGVTVYQVENKIENSDYSPNSSAATITIGSGLSAAGGSATVTFSAYHYGYDYYTSGSYNNNHVHYDTASVAITTDNNGRFSLSGNTSGTSSSNTCTVNHSTMGTTATTDSLVITCTNKKYTTATKTAGKDIENKIENSDYSPNSSAATCTISAGMVASGGSATVTFSAYHYGYDYYTSGSYNNNHIHYDKASVEITENGNSRFSLDGTTSGTSSSNTCSVNHSSMGVEATDDAVSIKCTNNTYTAATKTASTSINNKIETYGAVNVTITNPGTIAASGGSYNSATYTTSQTITYTSKSTRAGVFNKVSFNTVSAESKGTGISNSTAAGTLTATVTGEGGVTGSDSTTIYQNANYVSSIGVGGVSLNYGSSEFYAGGESRNDSGSTGSVTFYFTSGSNTTTTPSSTYGSLTGPSTTYSLTTGNGFSISSSGKVTAENRTTTTGSSRTSNTITKKCSYTWTPTSSYPGGTKTNSDSETCTCTQAANSRWWEYDTPSITAGTYSTFPAVGATYTPGSGIYYQSYRYRYSSNSTSDESSTRSGGTYEYSMGTYAGFALNSTSTGSLTAADRSTTTGDARTASVSVRVKVNGVWSSWASITATQVANSRWWEYDTPSITAGTYSTFSAAGETKEPSDPSYSQVYRYRYSSTHTSDQATATTGGVLNYYVYAGVGNCEMKDATTGKLKFPSRTTVTGASWSAQIRVTVKMNDVTSSEASLTATQAANSLDNTDYSPHASAATVTIGSGMAASGGSATVTFNAYHYSYDYYTSGSYNNEHVVYDTASVAITNDNNSRYSLTGTTSGTSSSNTCTVKHGSMGTAATTDNLTITCTNKNYTSATATASTSIKNEITDYGTLTVTITNPGTISAGGGSYNSAPFETAQTITYTSTATRKGYFYNYSFNKVSADTKGITISNSNSVADLVVSVTGENRTASASTTIYQDGNYVSSIAVGGVSLNYGSSNFSAGGESRTDSGSNGSITYTFTSGSKTTTVPSSTYGSLSGPSKTYTLATGNGFSLSNGSNGTITAENRTTTTGSTRTSNKITKSCSYTWYPTSSYPGGTKTNTGSVTGTCTQAANSRWWEYDTPSISSAGAYDTFPAGGATKDPSAPSYSQVYRYRYTSNSTSNQATATTGAAISYAMNTTEGFTLNSASTGNLTAANRETSTGSSRTATVTVTVKMNNKSTSANITATQSSNTRWHSTNVLYPYKPDSTWIVDVVNYEWQTCPASGGYIATYAYYGYTYSSGSYVEEYQGNDPTLTFSGGQPSWVTKHTYGYHINSRGTDTGDSRTFYVTWVSDGITSNTKSCTQEKNEITNYDYSASNSDYTAYVNIGDGMVASGGSATVSYGASHTHTYYYLYTSNSTSGPYYSYPGDTSSVKITSNGNSRFSLSGTTSSTASSNSCTLNHDNMTTNNVTDTVTVSVYNHGYSTTSAITATTKSIYNGYSDSWNNPSVSAFSYSQIAASGGTSTPSYAASQSGTRTFDSTSTSPLSNTSFTWSFSGETSGRFTLVSTSTGQMSASTKSTSVEGVTSSDTITAYAVAHSKTGSRTTKCTQASNGVVTTEWKYPTMSLSYSPATIAAGGGTSTPTYSASQSGVLTYTSKATATTSNSSFNWAFSMTSGNGFSINTSTGIVTVASRGTETGDSRSSNTITVTATGAGSLSVSKTATVSQEKNEITNYDYGASNTSYTASVSIGSGLAASGGSATITASASHKHIYYYLYTSQSTSGPYNSYPSDTYTLSKTEDTYGTFTLSGTTLSHSDMTTNNRTEYVTIKCTNNGNTSATDTARTSVYNGYSDSWNNPSVSAFSYSQIAASGGTSTPTYAASQSGTRTFDSTSTSPLSNNSFTWSFSGETSGRFTLVSTSTGQMSASTKSTSEGEGVTSSDTITAYATAYGKTGSKTTKCTQANNTYSDSWNNPSITSFTYSQIGADGGTSTPTYSGTQSGTRTYASTSTKGLTCTTFTWSFSMTNSGRFTLVSTSTGQVSASTKDTSIESVTSSDTITVYAVAHSRTGSTTTKCTQAANSRWTDSDYNDNWSSSVSIGSGLVASGGTATVTYSASHTYYYRYKYSSGSYLPSSTGYYNYGVTDSAKVAITSNGNSRFSLSGTTSGTASSNSCTLNHGNMTINNVTDSVTVTCTNLNHTATTNTASKSIYNNYSDAWDDPTISSFSYPTTIPASGGTSSPSISVSQSGRRTYTSGSQTDLTNTSFTYYYFLSTVGEVEFDIDDSTGVVTAPSRGTTEGDMWYCEYGVEVTGICGYTSSMLADCYQAANAITATSNSNWAVSVNSNSISVGTGAGSGKSIGCKSASHTATYTYTSGSQSSETIYDNFYCSTSDNWITITN